MCRSGLIWSMTYYETLASGTGGNSNADKMMIRLYANIGTIDGNYVDDTSSNINTALENAANQLLNHGSISEYEIVRFRSDKTGLNYPCIDWQDSTQVLIDDFKKFLKSTVTGPSSCPLMNNGTGDDLYSLEGVHALVHDFGCNNDTNGSNAMDNTCDGNTTPFTRGRMSWFDATCTELSKNAAIQESLHPFIMENHPDVTPMLNSNDDEHSLGQIMNFDGTEGVTPLLTFHQGEQNGGDCSTSKDTSIHYAQTLTSCTKDAVKFVSTDPDCTN